MGWRVVVQSSEADVPGRDQRNAKSWRRGAGCALRPAMSLETTIFAERQFDGVPRRTRPALPGQRILQAHVLRCAKIAGSICSSAWLEQFADLEDSLMSAGVSLRKRKASGRPNQISLVHQLEESLADRHARDAHGLCDVDVDQALVRPNLSTLQLAAKILSRSAGAGCRDAQPVFDPSS